MITRPGHVAMLFKARTGRDIDEAAIELREQMVPDSEIARRLGYANAGAIRRRLGLSPRAKVLRKKREAMSKKLNLELIEIMKSNGMSRREMARTFGYDHPTQFSRDVSRRFPGVLDDDES